VTDDLFHKADALVGRYRGETKPEPDFPTLTEVVETLPTPPAAVAPPEGPPAPVDEAALEAVRVRLLERLQPEVERLLSAAIEGGRTQLEDQLRVALHQLLSEAETDIQQQLRDRLDAAVTEAVEILRRESGR
jgi:hypothetical protein